MKSTNINPNKKMVIIRESIILLLSLFILIVVFYNGAILFGITPENRCSNMVPGSDKAYCYSDVAVDKNDETYCEKIDFSHSTLGEEYFREECYVNFAWKRGGDLDFSFCDNIKQEATNKYPWQNATINSKWQSCIHWLIIHGAQTNEELCDKISESNKKRDCIENIPS